MTAPIWSALYSGADLLKWQVAHEMATDLVDDALLVSDTGKNSFHLLRLHEPELVFRMITLRCLVRAAPNARTNFYVHHYGNIDVAEIGWDGEVKNSGSSTSITVTGLPDAELEIEVQFLNCHASLSIGTSIDGSPVYAGDGGEQFAIKRIVVEARDAHPALSAVEEDDRIRIVDVGAQEGLQLKWMLQADRITPVLFEPIPSEAEKLRLIIDRLPGGKVIEKALAHVSGTQTLFIAKASGCSSLKEPNLELLNNYSIGWIFETVAKRPVDCVRYDELFRQNLAPAPDVIKIDVQGFEYEVLLGFGHLLDNCLGIELETHSYPIYMGERVTGEIVEFLADFGFVLRRLDPVPNFDGDAIEFDAYFTKRRSDILRLSERSKRKFATITEVWGLAPYW